MSPHISHNHRHHLSYYNYYYHLSIVITTVLLLISTTLTHQQQEQHSYEHLNSNFEDLYSFNSSECLNNECKSSTYSFNNIKKETNFDEINLYFKFNESLNSNVEFSLLNHDDNNNQNIVTSILFNIKQNEQLNDKLFLTFYSKFGLFNIDMTKQLNISISNINNTLIHYLNDDEFGTVNFKPNSIDLELNLLQIFNSINGIFKIDINGNRNSKIMNLNEWNQVSFPSSFELQFPNERFLTFSFPFQSANDKFGSFKIIENNLIDRNDLSHDIDNFENIKILQSYLYNDLNLNIENSILTFNFGNLTTIKDIYGNEYNINVNSLKCAATYGNGYIKGKTIIKPVYSFNDGKILKCIGDSVFRNNSLITILGLISELNIIKIKDESQIKGKVTKTEGKYFQVEIQSDSCVAFDGVVSLNRMKIYGLQQELTKEENIILPSPSKNDTFYMESILGGDQVKFCVNSQIYSKIGNSKKQVIVFYFISEHVESEFKFKVHISPFWKLPVVISSVIGTVVMVTLAVFIMLIIYSCTRKKYKYNPMN